MVFAKILNIKKYSFCIIVLSLTLSSKAQIKTIEAQFDKIDSLVAKSSNEGAVLPGPTYNPSLGVGIAIMPITVYNIKGQSAETRPSSTQGLAYASITKSYALGLKQTVFLNSNKFWLEGIFNYSSYRLEYHGIGQFGHLPDPEWVRTLALVFDVSGQMRVLTDFYVGLSFNIKSVEIKGETDKGNAWLEHDGFSTEREFIVMPGMKFSYDGRDHQFTPHSGILSTFFFNHANKRYGSTLDYSLFGFVFSNYHTVKDDKGVFAWQYYFRGSAGDVPLYDYSSPGKSKVLRGYISGKHLDKSIMTIQAEYRLPLHNRWGAAVFTGVGKVFPEIKGISTSDLLPSVGGGIRYLLLKSQKVNARLDIAFGRNDFNIYFGLSEAF